MLPRLLTGTLARPDFGRWPDWSYEDYLCFFLSEQAARERLAGAPSPVGGLDDRAFRAFCRPIRDRFVRQFGGSAPRLSILVPAYDEERELLPTLLSYTLLDLPPGTAEVVVADNASDDRTRRVVEACGARYVYCARRGVAHARSAAFHAASDASEYVWMTDADVRVVPPLCDEADLRERSDVLARALAYMDAHRDVLGISTGAGVERAHWLYHLVHEAAVRLGRTHRYSCWAGSNQFVRKDALRAIGGIDVEMDYREDQQRHFELVRLAMVTGRRVVSANRHRDLIAPVYYSGRRYATLGLVVRHLVEVLRRPPLERDEHGFPVYQKGMDWRVVRRR